MGKRGLQSKVNVTEALQDRIAGKLSYEKIGKIQGVTGKQIQRMIKPLEKLMSNDNEIALYDRYRPNVLKSIQLWCIRLLAAREADLKVSDIINLFKESYKMERLEEGRPTEIHSTHTLPSSPFVQVLNNITVSPDKS